MNTLAAERGDRLLPDEQTCADIAWAFQDAVVDTLAIKCLRALRQTGFSRLVIAGGVSANLRLREVLEQRLAKVDGQVFYARQEFCTDNAAMIALAGCRRLLAGQCDDLALQPRPRWSLDSLPPLEAGSTPRVDTSSAAPCPPAQGV